MDLSLDGTVALVTAASRGIGAAVTTRLANEGATVVAVSRSGAEPERVDRGRVVSWSVDLADAEVTEGLVDRVVAEFGQLDSVVVNTPGPPLLRVADTTWQTWQESHDLLLRPAVQVGTAAARVMSAQGSGTIAFMTSTWVVQPVEGGVLSAAYRSAVAALSRTLALELAPTGVRVVQIMPGATETERMRRIIETKSAARGTTIEDEVQAIADGVPIGRWAQPEEIADVVAFMLSKRASFMTGSSVIVDGGAVRRTS